MFILFLRFLKGYVRIRISGDFPERFINICAANSISLWNIKRFGEVIYANIKIKDYLKIRKLRKNVMVRVKIISKKGLAFIVRPYIKRAGLFVGVILFVFINVFLSSYIWNINIIGNVNIKENQIIKMCKEIGIKEGTPSLMIDTNEARLKLLMKNKELSWCSFIIEGSHLTVNVSEVEKPITEDKSPCNFIAKSDGVITKIRISSGKAVIKENQAVLKGQLIASGVLEYKDGSTEFTRCSGEIFALIKKQIEVEVPFEYEKKIVSEKNDKRYILSLFGNKFLLNYFPISYDFKKEIKLKKIEYNNAYLPIYLHEVTINKIEKKKMKRDYNEAVEISKKKIEKIEKSDLNNCEIIDFNDEISYNNNGITLKRSYEIIENIATPEKIKINTVN